jgi:hypothetical protein
VSISGKTPEGRRCSKCKGLGAGEYLLCWKNLREAHATGGQWARGRIMGKEVREVLVEGTFYSAMVRGHGKDGSFYCKWDGNHYSQNNRV